MGLRSKPVLRAGRSALWRYPFVAIYSLNHSSIGRSTHAAGTAGAHVGYITRSAACREVMAERMPTAQPGKRGGAARAWLDDQEAGDRKNGRVIDKVMLALPRELTPEQQSALVRGFAEEVTQGRAPWLAAIHQDHPDNPHAHLVIRDKDPETGKRVIGLSEKGSTDRLREAWEVAANLALAKAGRDERIDRRSLKDQGLEREATVHIGPQAAAMERQGKEIVSQTREVRTRKGTLREVRWAEIDGGERRSAHNDRVRARNAARERARSPQEPRQAPGSPIAAERPLEAPVAAQERIGAASRHPTRAALYRLSKARDGADYARMSKPQLLAVWDREIGVVLQSVQDRAGAVLKKIEEAGRRVLSPGRREELERVAKRLSSALMLRQIARRILVKANPDLNTALERADRTPDSALEALKAHSQAEHEARRDEARKLWNRERSEMAARLPSEPVPGRPAQVQVPPSPALSPGVPEQVRRAAQEEVERFRQAAQARQVFAYGYTDISDHWLQMPTAERAAIEGHNKLSPGDQKQALERMQAGLVARYLADPTAIDRDRDRHREARDRGVSR